MLKHKYAIGIQQDFNYSHPQFWVIHVACAVSVYQTLLSSQQGPTKTAVAI